MQDASLLGLGLGFALVYYFFKGGGEVGFLEDLGILGIGHG